jgi:MFS superfamily sulfate permease-like transporter
MTAVAVGVVLIALTGVLADLPEATLGAVVLMAAWGLVDLTNIRRILSVSRRDGLLGIAAAVAVAVLGVLDGIFVTVVLSILVLLHEANAVQVRHFGPVTDGGWDDVDGEGQLVHGMLVVHPEGRLYFGNVQRACARIVELVDAHDPDVVVVDGTAVPSMEITAVVALSELAATLEDEGREVWLAGMSDDVVGLTRRAGAPQLERRLHLNLEHAHRAFRDRPSG